MHIWVPLARYSRGARARRGDARRSEGRCPGGARSRGQFTDTPVWYPWLAVGAALYIQTTRSDMDRAARCEPVRSVGLHTEVGDMMNQVRFARAGLITAALRTIDDINIPSADLTTVVRPS
jgi:hypothetical protein